MPRILIALLFCLLGVILCTQAAIAAQTGILAGTITDLDGNGIPGVSVTLCRGNVVVGSVADNPQTTISDPAIGPVGHYGFKGLTQGNYKLIVKKTIGPGQEYSAEQTVTVTDGTVIQDIVLDIPRTTPVPEYRPINTAATPGFSPLLAILALAGLVLRRGI